MRQGPLAGRYAPVAAMVMCALIPYLALSAALEPLTHILIHRFHVSLQTLSLGNGMGNAAYAVGTVLAVQFAQHFPQRRMMAGYAVLLVVGSVLQASAQNATMFLAGHILQGLCTSLLLIAAVPPLAIGFPRDKLRDTAVIMNMCIFGAVALGPLVGGIQAEAHAWRPLFWVVSGVSLLALLLVALTFEDAPPANPESPRDPLAILLAAVGCVAAFFGASELTSHAFLNPICIWPLAGGLLTIVALVVYQTITPRPLLTVKLVLTSAIPVAGIVVALFAAAASVSATALTISVLAPHYSPEHIGLLYLPEVGGAVLSAVALGLLIQRRGLHYLPLFGMLCLAAGIALFRIEVPSSETLTLVGSGLTGIGLGATVAPALFVAGFSLPSMNLQRVFAIVELLRAVAAFMIAPIFAHFALTVGPNLVSGTGTALWIGLGLALGGAAVGIIIYLLSGARPQTPDIDAFLDGAEPAWYSPDLLARLRGRPYAIAGVAAAGRDAGGVQETPGALTPTPSVQLTADGSAAHWHVDGSVTHPGGSGAPTNGNGRGPAPVPEGAGVVMSVAEDAAAMSDGPVLIAYDGSELSRRAIEQAGHQLGAHRDAIVLCVWTPADVGFQPLGEDIDATQAHRVERAAQAVADQGRELAAAAGFSAHATTRRTTPIWRGIVEAADAYAAGVIVIGTHRRRGIAGHLGGSVAAAVITHATRPVLVVHQAAETPARVD